VNGRSPSDSPSRTGTAAHVGLRIAVVANPSKIPQPTALRSLVTAVLADHGWPPPLWLETRRDDPGGGQTRAAVDAGVDIVLAAGGDGTVRACAEQLVGTDTALAILPFGTGNLLARNLGVQSDPREALAAVTSGRRRRLDVGVLEGRTFVVMAGVGLDALMLRDAPEALKRRLGWPAYVWAATKHLCEPPMTLTLRIGEEKAITRRARLVLIGNVGRLQAGIPVMPGARPDDGVLDVAILMPPRRISWVPLAWALVRRVPAPPLLELYHAARLEVTSRRRHLWELDGDVLGPADSLTVAVRPGALTVCVPRDTGGGSSAVRPTAPTIKP
jgi:diacylglycerol kinase family enzyme